MYQPLISIVFKNDLFLKAPMFTFVNLGVGAVNF